MDYATIKTEYLCYLMNRAGLEAEGDRGYSGLCQKMMDTEFIPFLMMDENRSYECRELRQDFEDYCHEDNMKDALDIIYSESGTMMELLVVLVERIRYDLLDSEYEANVQKWSLELLENCGLDVMTNGEIENRDQDDIDDILRCINYRQFNYEGIGSFFPLRWARRDQRYEELIVQMNNYIEENYDIC